MTEDQISLTGCFPLVEGPATAEFITTIIFTGRPKRNDQAVFCLVVEGFHCLVPVFEAGLWGLSPLDCQAQPLSLIYKRFYVHLDHTKPLMRDPCIAPYCPESIYWLCPAYFVRLWPLGSAMAAVLWNPASTGASCWVLPAQL